MKKNKFIHNRVDDTICEYQLINIAILHEPAHSEVF